MRRTALYVHFFLNEAGNVVKRTKRGKGTGWALPILTGAKIIACFKGNKSLTDDRCQPEKRIERNLRPEIPQS
jgi:hypothetical protein